MRIMTYNVRGLGGKVKRRVIRQLIQKEEVDVVCIQESKMAKLDRRVGRELWGDCEVEWREVEAINNAGGVLTLWGKRKFKVNDQVLGNNFVGIKGTWKEETEEMVIVNMYSLCNIVGKKAMWRELIDLKMRSGDGI